MMPITHGIVGSDQGVDLDLLMTLIPIDLVAVCALEVTGGDFTVDWGDGILQTYPDGTQPAVVPTGNIIVRTITPPSTFRAVTNTYSDIAMGNGAGTGSITTVSGSFFNLTSLATIDILKLNTSNVTDFSFFLGRSFSLLSIDLSNINVTNKATDLTSLLEQCGATSIIFPATMDTVNVVGMQDMLAKTKMTGPLDMSIMTNTSNCAAFDGVFAGSLFSSIDLTTWSFASATNLTGFVSTTNNLTCITNVDTLTNLPTTTAMFDSTPLLTAPNATEQAAILAGSNYVNANPCP